MPEPSKFGLDLLHGTVFQTISIKSVTLVFSSAASKLNYFVEHTSLVLVSAPGRSVNIAIEMTVLLSHDGSAVQMEPERLWWKGIVKRMSFKSGVKGRGSYRW